MGTLAAQLAAGEGRFRSIVVIAGWPEIFVDDASLVRTRSDGREQVLGLLPDGFRISQRPDLLRGGLSAQEQMITIVDDDAGTITASLGKTRTDARTFLTADINTTATTMSVSSTAGFPSSGVLHVHTEAIKYTGRTATTFTGLTRGYWNTLAQGHSGPASGTRLSGSVVTDRPRSLRGRRVRWSLLGRADADTSEGTLKWQGFAREDRAYQGGQWSIPAAPLSHVLEQSVGGDLEDPAPILGIYLPSTSCLVMGLARLDTDRVGGSRVAADSGFIRLSGWWPTNEAFVEDLNTELASFTSGWGWGAGASLTAESLGPNGWRVVYRADGTTPHFVGLTGNPINYAWGEYPGEGGRMGVSPVDLFVHDDSGGFANWRDMSGDPVVQMSAGGLYVMEFEAPTPRAVVGGDTSGMPFGALFSDDTRPENIGGRLYVGGGTALTTSMFAVVLPNGEDEEGVMAPVTAVSDSARSIDVGGMAATLLGPQSRIRLARVLAENQGVEGLITLLALQSAAIANRGAMPFIGFSDFDFDFSAAQEAAADLRMSRRTWITQEGISVREILEHELRLLGCYLSVRQNGAMTVRRLRAPLVTDVEAGRVTPRNLAKGPPGLSLSPFGTLRELIFRQGWDWIEGEHAGVSIRARNEETEDGSTFGGTLEVAPRSRAVTTGDFGFEIDVEMAYALASSALGLFGGGYSIATLGVTLGTGEGSAALFEAELGQTILVTSPMLPDVDGTMGTTLRPGVLVSVDWEPYALTGTIDVLFVDLPISGYAPELPIASEVDEGGDLWTLTLTTSGYVETGTDVADWFEVGDEVQVRLRGLSARSTTTTVADATGNAGDVTLTGSQAYTDGPGGYQGAIDFNGIGGGRTTGVGTAAQWAALTSDCTITVWVRPDQIVARQQIAVFYGGTGETEADNILAEVGIEASGFPRLFFEHGAGSNVSLLATTAVTVGEWSRIDWVRDSSAGTVECFIDGASVDTFTSQPDATGGTTSRAIAIGETNSGVNRFNGAIYGLTLRDVAKSDASIAAERTLSAPDGDTVGMWLRVAPAPVTGEVTAVTATTAEVQLDATAALGTGDWVLCYQPSSAVDETPNGSKRWSQADFCFVADTVRRSTFGSGDQDAREFAP